RRKSRALSTVPGIRSARASARTYRCTARVVRGSDAMLRERSLLRIASAVLVLSLFVPIETWNDGPRFLWEIGPGLRPASIFVLVGPEVAGAAILAASFMCRRPAALAVVTLASLAGLLMVMAAGATALACDLLPQPEVWRVGPGPAVAGVGFV